jgi:hypothetical protein
MTKIKVDEHVRGVWRSGACDLESVPDAPPDGFPAARHGDLPTRAAGVDRSDERPPVNL